MNTAAYAERHTQYVYGTRDDSVWISFTECEKIGLLNTFTQHTFNHLDFKHRNTLYSAWPKNLPHWCRLFMTHLTPSTNSNITQKLHFIASVSIFRAAPTTKRTPKPSTCLPDVDFSRRLIPKHAIFFFKGSHLPAWIHVLLGPDSGPP